MGKCDALENLAKVIDDRRKNPQDDSYTCYLFEQGINKILKKCGEENAEMIIAAKNEDNEELANEICDLFYHILVMMNERGVKLDEVMDILNKRAEKIGNLKNFHTSDHNS